jgi:tRNA(fMet)-specific endonuclease VapC
MEVALDTNALSDFAAGNEDLGRVLQPFRSLALPAIALGEYRYGLMGSKHQARLSEWLAELLTDVHILEVKARTSTVYARVRQQLRKAGTPIPENDVWIAASAIEHDLPLLTRDRHFRNVNGLEVLTW